MDNTVDITIRSGKLDELRVALDLLCKAAVWLRNKNIDYWQNWIDPPDTHIQWIKSGFENGDFYFVHDSENRIVGMYRLQYSDEEFWGKRNDKAGYIHSFTTNRDYAGKGIGNFILQSIEKELAQNGVNYLRLDCSPDVEGLCKYYESYGFKPKETVFVHGEKLRLYEKKIS